MSEKGQKKKKGGWTDTSEQRKLLSPRCQLPLLLNAGTLPCLVAMLVVGWHRYNNHTCRQANPPGSTHSHAFAVAKTSTANQLSLFLSQCTNDIAQPEFGCQSTQQNSCQVETPTQNMQVSPKKLKLFRNRKEPKRSTKTRKTDPLRGETSFECPISSSHVIFQSDYQTHPP